MSLEKEARGPSRGLEAQSNRAPPARFAAWSERVAGNVFLLPAVLVVLLLALFPLILSLYLALSRLRFVPGGFEINFVGVANFRRLFVGSEQRHFLGVLADPSPLGWIVFGMVLMLLAWGLVRYLRGGHASVGGFVYRAVVAGILSFLAWYVISTLSAGGRPGTLVVTLVYVFVGIALQYLIGLGLALLTTQRLLGRRFFRVVFLLPMMITPVGVAYMFWMLADTTKGPLKPLWGIIGLANYSWVNDPWSARWAIMIGDVWQWTPLMFIVLLAALEGQPVELVEAALVDGASQWQIYWHITLPQLLPVSMTLILIRMIEGFKIVDLPNVMTSGGPGTATESLTLHAFFAWRTLDVGTAMAVAFTLLVIVMFFATTLVNLAPRGRT
jgi:multiple sugar transport system permease protein